MSVRPSCIQERVAGHPGLQNEILSDREKEHQLLSEFKFSSPKSFTFYVHKLNKLLP